MNIKHSLVVPVRGRHIALGTLIAALETCMKAVDDWEVMFVHLADYEFESPIENVQFEFQWELIMFPRHKPFPKSTAINHGVKYARGEFVTILDVDCIPQPLFLKSISEFFDDPANRNVKFGHRVRLLSKEQTFEVNRKGLPWAQLNVFSKGDEMPKAHETLLGIVTGNSQCSMSRENFLNCKYDERFCLGMGLEDAEWGLRWNRKIGPTTILQRSAGGGLDLFHLFHQPNADWRGDPKAHQKLFDESVAAGFPDPPETEEWGEIPLDEDFNTRQPDVDGPLLSILIATMPCRADFLKRLLAVLEPQLTDQVELLIEENTDSILGDMRQKLLERSRGQWVVYIDDDDMVTERYVQSILEALEAERPDCVTFLQERRFNGTYLGFARYGVNEKWEDSRRGAQVCTRPPGPVTPIRRAYALQVGFESLKQAEDYEFSMAVKWLLKREVFVNDILYVYLRRSDKGKC